MRTVHRSRWPTTIAALAIVIGACGGAVSSDLPPDARRSLEAGRAAARAWISEGRSAGVEPTTAVALGYLERLRLGFGSPFRLVDQATQDPRLADTLRVRVGWALLARLLDGDAYEIDPGALDRAGFGRYDQWPGAGRQHLRLIEGTISESRDPRGGELAVRLAYGLAAAEGSLSSRAPRLAARAAALLRDRELAVADARSLLRAAAADSTDPLVLLRRWRAERRFQVEAPASTPLAAVTELEASRIALRLAGALREQAARADESRPDRAHRAATLPSLLGAPAAAALRRAAAELNAPPQTPVALAARNYRRELLDDRFGAEEQARRARFIEEGVSEEGFVAALAGLERTSAFDVAPSLATLWAAVALRAYGQEPVWFPGFGGPSARELQERHGLDVAFGDDVPADWRPFYRRMLDQSLSDLRLVLPSLDLKGLRVVIERDAPRQEGTLAMHDPKGRRLLLPPATALGTVAHEVAHDLDWQIALRRYRVRGDYATDRATRTRDPQLAMRLHELSAGAASLESVPDRISAHARRPAEIFARSLDWFVAVSLASDGRVNGYLSSVQDDILTGYGTVRSPDVTGTAGKALIAILDEVAPVYPSTREWFLRSYGPSRALTAYDLVRRVLEAAQPPDELTRDEPAAAPEPGGPDVATAAIFDEIVAARDAALAEIDAWICRVPGAAYDRNLEIARRRLVIEAAGARARGLARYEAHIVGGEPAERWLSRELMGAPMTAGAADSAMVELLRPLASGARDVSATQPEDDRSGFQLAGPPEHCGAQPFLSVFAPVFSR